MYIANAYYKAIPVTGATFPLAAGTIVTANGTTPASAAEYFGIVPEKVEKMPTTGHIFVAVSGTIDLDTCGVAFTDAQIKALGADFNFVRAAEIAEPAPELPAVTSDDNGKILKVVSGEWAAATAPSSAGALYVNGTFSSDVWTLDSSYNDILAAVTAGKTVILVTDNSSSGIDADRYRYLDGLSVSSGTYGATFSNYGGQLEFAASSADANMTEA